jgi:HK97 family phage major capsid protein
VKAFETGILASRCSRIQISSGSNSIKLPAVDETSRATGSRWGGVRGYWLSEAAEKQASKPKFRSLELSLKKNVVLIYATDELLQDATALEGFIRMAAPDEIGFQVDDAIINGTGAGMPLGLLNSGALISVPKETGQTAATVIFENVSKMYARMPSRNRKNAVWLINQGIEPQLFSMSLATGTGGVPVYMPAGGASSQPYGTLFGRPVLPIEQCAALGTVGDIIFADLSSYILADKAGIESAMSVHVRFVWDESVFRFIYRVDGQPILASSITPFGGGDALSPFVALAARA